LFVTGWFREGVFGCKNDVSADSGSDSICKKKQGSGAVRAVRAVRV
jgi:hypothetical protein